MEQGQEVLLLHQSHSRNKGYWDIALYINPWWASLSLCLLPRGWSINVFIIFRFVPGLPGQDQWCSWLYPGWHVQNRPVFLAAPGHPGGHRLWVLHTGQHPLGELGMQGLLSDHFFLIILRRSRWGDGHGGCCFPGWLSTSWTSSSSQLSQASSASILHPSSPQVMSTTHSSGNVTMTNTIQWNAKVLKVLWEYF